jgi:dienelactone hydrolase
METVVAGVFFIFQLPAFQAPPGLSVIPWVVEGNAAWYEAGPLFDVADAEAGTSAQGWAAVTDRYIRLRVLVKDDKHVNTRRGGDIWDGDSLQIGVDARGDGSGRLPEDMPMVGPDDASIAVALTPDGPKMWAHFQGKFGRSYMTDGTRDYPCSVVRDEQAGTTLYDVAFPWDAFDGAAGASPLIGLSVQVNDSNDGEQRRLFWGRGAGGEPRPGLFNKLLVGPPPHETVSLEVRHGSLWRPTGRAEVLLAVASDRQLTIRTQMGQAAQELRLEPARLADGCRRFVVQAAPGRLPEEPLGLNVELVADDGAVLAARTVPIDAPGRVIGQLQDRIEELVARSPHPLFTRHLRSVDAMVQNEWNRAMLIVDDDEQVARDCIRDATTILQGLNADAGQWEAYRRGQRSLVLARLSSYDGSVQYYTLSLPRDWDPERAYPLIAYLHGAGPSHPLFYMEITFRPREAPQAGTEAAPLEPHYSLVPWGRGNRGWAETAEDDLWEALAEVDRDFRVDHDRVYLTGHSMGGGGAWAIALRTPSHWAAVCPCAGGTWNAPPGWGLGRNASYLPFRIWHGDADGAVPVENAHAMQAELRRYGNEPDMVIVPGQGHDLPGDQTEANARWLLQHVRKRPDQFAFVADTRRHRGAWGIEMNPSAAPDRLPSFECRTEGQTVHISSENTPGLSVELGQGGLGLAGDVTVYWNGRQAYAGQAERITLGEEARRRR